MAGHGRGLVGIACLVLIGAEANGPSWIYDVTSGHVTSAPVTPVPRSAVTWSEVTWPEVRSHIQDCGSALAAVSTKPVTITTAGHMMASACGNIAPITIWSFCFRCQRMLEKQWWLSAAVCGYRGELFLYLWRWLFVGQRSNVLRR